MAEPPREPKSKRALKRAQELEELLETKENVLATSPELHVQYTIAKSHPVTKFMLGKYGKGRKWNLLFDF